MRWRLVLGSDVRLTQGCALPHCMLKGFTRHNPLISLSDLERLLNGRGVD